MKLMRLKQTFIVLTAFPLAALHQMYALELKATRVQRGPVLDGVLSDEVWKQANPFSDFKMVESQPNSEPTEGTELRILYDETSLYLG